jgi:hypothetical protein
MPNQQSLRRAEYLDLFVHVCNLIILGLNLLFQLFDLVVQHKFELFKLLILFLEIIDAFFLF